jgi:hypothetical protein
MNEGYTGVIQGGWPFVIAAYTASALVLGGYTISVYARYRRELDRRRKEGEARP